MLIPRIVTKNESQNNNNNYRKPSLIRIILGEVIRINEAKGSSKSNKFLGNKINGIF
jgi:hypothetical protein